MLALVHHCNHGVARLKVNALMQEQTGAKAKKKQHTALQVLQFPQHLFQAVGARNQDMNAQHARNQSHGTAIQKKNAKMLEQTGALAAKGKNGAIRKDVQSAVQLNYGIVILNQNVLIMVGTGAEHTALMQNAQLVQKNNTGIVIQNKNALMQVQNGVKIFMEDGAIIMNVRNAQKTNHGTAIQKKTAQMAGITGVTITARINLVWNAQRNNHGVAEQNFHAKVPAGTGAVMKKMDGARKKNALHAARIRLNFV